MTPPTLSAPQTLSAASVRLLPGTFDPINETATVNAVYLDASGNVVQTVSVTFTFAHFEAAFSMAAGQFATRLRTALVNRLGGNAQ